MSDRPIQTEAQRVAADVIRRETRRVRSLSVLTIALWIISVFLIAGVALPALAKMKQLAVVLKQPGPDGKPLSAEAIANLLSQVLPGLLVVGVLMLGMALLTGLLASISTVALSLTIRRITLRQITESLAQISTQIRELKPPPAA